MTSLPQLYKGIALFTPGGDLIYTVDPQKRDRWHLHLCIALQEILDLPEPPHFLVPAYTATIDRWQDLHTGEIKTIAEVYPAVKRYIPLLKVLFNYEKWQIATWQEEYCNPNLINTQREFFPNLWAENQLILRLDAESLSYGFPKNFDSTLTTKPSLSSNTTNFQNTGYVLRLFISRDNPNIAKTLSSIHQALEKGLTQPYTLKIVDISKNPEQAERDRIFATPALVRVLPEPVKKVVGELDNVEKIVKIISS